MTEQEALSLCFKEAKRIGITDEVVFEINPRLKRALGRCRFGDMDYLRLVVTAPSLIDLNKRYVLGGKDDQIRDTILHELAHHLAWRDFKHRNHGLRWQNKCILIGADPTRQKNAEFEKAYKWLIKCVSCDKVVAQRYVVKRNLLKRYSSNCCNSSLIAEEL